MYKKLSLVILWTCFVHEVSFCSPIERTICVQCSPTTTSSSSELACNHTVNSNHLDDIKNKPISDYTLIQFHSGISLLHSLVHFSDINHLALVGTIGSTVHCDSFSPPTGFKFVNVSNLSIKNLQVVGCKTEFLKLIPSLLSTEHAISVNGSESIFLFECNNVTLVNVYIKKKNVTGISMHNTIGKVNVLNCTFNNERNGSQKIIHGHGVYIEFNCCKKNYKNVTSYSHYQFTNCSFINNVAIGSNSPQGGGMAIEFRGNASNHFVSIVSCNFINNSAVLGGGLMARFQNSASNNTVIVSKTQFLNNTVRNAGGGVNVQSKRFFNGIQNKVTFKNCSWTNNAAKYGSGLDVFYCQEMHFTLSVADCSFDGNFVTSYQKINISNVVYPGIGTLLSTSSPVTFNGKQEFFNNSGSAIVLRNATLRIMSGSETQFLANSGRQGGALSLYEESRIKLESSTSLSFINNSANEYGGAIYAQHYTPDLDSIKWHYSNCLFSYELPFNQNNVSFLFSGNQAVKKFGNSIFVPTLIPCCSMFIGNRSNYVETFTCIGKFTYENIDGNEVSTLESNLMTTTSPVSAIPGKEIQLPLLLRNELNQTMPLKSCQVHLSGNQILLAEELSSKSLQNCSKITLYGLPGEETSVKISTQGIRSLKCKIDIQLQYCPPGYVFSTRRKACECSAMLVNLAYQGIEKCNNSQMRAFIKRGYWVGYDSNGNETEDSLICSICPHCHPVDNNLLPGIASRQALDSLLCGPDRTGILCGKCVANYTTLFHNNDFECYPENETCKYGFLLYILSECIPVTILFLIILIFNISFTAGAVNGFVFFAQFVVSMQSEGWGVVVLSTNTQKLLLSIQLLYKMFNLDFFSIHDLSFCIWKGANALDNLAMKYVTILYAFSLVTLTVLIMRLCSLPKFLKKIRLPRKSNTSRAKRSVVHGLSSFFVMCYTQCATVSIKILTTSLITGKGDFGYASYKRIVVFHHGEMEYFGTSHLPYAIPALLFAICFIIIPPSLLMFYPLCYKVFKVLCIKESCVRCLCRCIPLEKLRPLFDSIQSCFQDSCRYFAGLYFYYRLLPLLTFAFIKNDTFYGILELELIFMLGVHSIFQPYKQKWHNRVDTLLFLDLLVINTLSCWKYTLSRDPFENQYGNVISYFSIVQSVMMLLPLVYIIVYVLIQKFSIRNRLQHCWKVRNTQDIDNEESNLELSFIDRRQFDSSSEFDFDGDYQEIDRHN